MPLTAGTRLGPYEIVCAIGAGGMGEIYRARDTRLNRDVAVKVLPRLLATDESALARFEREAKALAALSHPNLLAIHDFGVHDRTAYAVTELLEGSTLRGRLVAGEKEHALPLRKVLDYGIQIAKGLAAAHGKQIVHRDLKPENVFVTADGRVKILDFGLAHQLEAVASDGVTVAAATTPGTVMGTVGYMAPEQVRGEAVDYRTDIFAFGCLLYEMVAGRRAFERPTAAETMTAILNDDPPTVSGPPELSLPLHSIILRCLEKQREERFQSASDLAFHLEQAREASGASRPIRERASLPPRTRSVVLVGLAFAIAAIGWFGRGLIGTPPAARAPAGHFVQLTDLPGLEHWPSLSPDGQSILYAGSSGGTEDIFLLRVGGRNPLNLTADSPSGDSQPAFSPDGTRIAFRSERSGGGIFVMGATGESVRRVTDFGFAPSWSPDGSELAVSTSSFIDPFSRNVGAKLFAVSVATGDRRLIDDGDAVQPAWSPHGQRIAFWGATDGGQRDIWTVPAVGSAAGRRVSVTADLATDWSPQWSPDGQWLYFLSDRGGLMNVWRTRIDESSGRVLGDAESVVAPAPAVSGITFSRNGQMAFSTLDQRTTIEQLPLDPVREAIAGPAELVLRGSRRIAFLDWSPDSQWLSFATVGARENIFLIRPDGSGYRQVTDDEFKNRGPVWSHDGSRIAFYSNRAGRYQVWSVSPDGGGLKQITSREGQVLVPIWSPTEQQLAVNLLTAHRSWALLDMRTGAPISVPQLPGVSLDSGYFLALAWSPDGASIAGVQLEAQRSAGEKGATFPVFVYTVRDQTFRKLDVSGGVRWMNDNRRLLVYGNTDISIVDSQTGRRKVLLPLGGRGAGNQFWGFALPPDNRRLALLSDEIEGDLWMIRER